MDEIISISLTTSKLGEKSRLIMHTNENGLINFYVNPIAASSALFSKNMQ